LCTFLDLLTIKLIFSVFCNCTKKWWYYMNFLERLFCA
jgi:hypothetical protein